ncbi:predicted protein [Phaeodactylum tricornutum CCAP 1055/1]|uniref:Uncharacterized protein n=3 Tax=Phaeodactylum tricornutum TaxID=2850 RepID=B7FW21_PHATC|nr:predicted protein [Phaeodactylum tricornutum CCAP 1055/1]EEC49507.1 predicted protein [Phaeodactylum tricornutum CCAP 1055/1]|eukprot:XP_002178809.1 predicted protein [Phaeodactylum tricornutum CCAP 1055/1]
MRAASMIFVLSSAVELARETRAFSPVASRAREVVHSATFLSAKKGFGSAPDPSKKKSGSTTAQQDSTSYPASSSSSISKDDENPARSAIATSTRSPQQRPNAGQRALEDMRRQQAEKKDAELRKVRELLDADQQVQEAAAAIPERVAQRMGARMLPFVGLPFFLGMGVFVGFWYMATYRNLEYQPALVAASTIVVLLLGLVGITYSILSASWDPDREGSLLGTDEFSKNIENIRDGLKRSRENAILRDKMAGLTSEELQKSIKDLERRDAASQRREQSLDRKLKDELD